MIISNRILFFVLIWALVVGCGSNSQVNEDAFDNDQQQETILKQEIIIPEEQIKELIQAMPSPLEMTFLIKESGASYDGRLLIETGNLAGYNTNFKKALNLGVYGTDLGYLNLYDKTAASISYLSAIKELADGIKVGQFFDFSTLRKLAANKDNVDSILYISTVGFNDMDSYLRGQNRSNLSALIVTGAWIEGLYLASQIAKNNPSDEMIKRIGEQKVVLDNIRIILSTYKNDKSFTSLISDFEKIKEQFNKVNISYVYGEPTQKEVDGVLVIEDNTKTNVEISTETLSNIISIVANTRKNITS